MSPESPSLRQKLLRQTNFLGLRLWVLIVALLSLAILLLLLLLCLYHIYCRRPRKTHNPHYRLPNSIITTRNCPSASSSSSLRRLLPLEIEAVKQGNQLVSDRWSSSSSRIQNLVGEIESGGRWSSASLEAWSSYRFTIKEIELATNGFSEDNVIGKGENGVVYRGRLLDNRRIAVKRLIYKSFPIENFVTGVEAITHVRHKNIVRMLGYCMEADHRILVYEYVDNGNLHHSLHGSLGSAPPLTWRIRINIIQGIAKGLAYLHEDIEPKIIHGDLKSSNILLDNQWNPKISDAALTAGLLNPHPRLEEYYSLTSLLHDEKSDVYNFGVLIMEIVTGKPPVIDCGESPVYLVDWLKSMVASKKIEQIVDPTLSDQIINLLELKRIILIALRCVVAEVEHRPKMKDVIYMLEPLDLLLNDKACNKRKDSSSNDGHDGRVEGASNVHLEEEAAITSMKKMSIRKPL